MQKIMTASRFAEREFVELTDMFGALASVPSCDFASSDLAGRGAAHLEAVLEEHSHHSAPSFAGINDFAKVAIVAYRGMRAHMQNCELVRLVQVPLYVTEVKPFQKIDPVHLELREAFARKTGFMLVGPDECIAALYKTRGTDPYTFCSVIENNDQGTPRTVCGFYADGAENWSQPVTVNELDATQTERMFSSWRSNYHYALPQTLVYSELQYERMRETLKLLVDHDSVAPPERSEHGSKIFRSFIENGDTSSTQNMRPYSDGWRKYPTWQDAWYFGQWFNPQMLELLCYAEQDVTLTVCESEEQFRAEMADLARAYGKDPSQSPIAGEDEGTSCMYDCVTMLRRDDGRRVALNFSKGDPALDDQGNPHMPLMAHLLVTHSSLLELLDGQTFVLTNDQFQMNILDPQSWAHTWAASATRRGDFVEVSLSRDGQQEPLVATASLKTGNNS